MVGGKELSEDETYAGTDIYAKGSFFMHSLRYVIGDEIFFSTLKKLATDPKYTYDNFVTTDDVDALFSSESKKNLKPLFDFYTKSTDVLDIVIKEAGYQKYLIKINNYFMDLPFDIKSSNGTNKIIIPKEGITVNSSFPPLVDPESYYLKKETLL